jgi:hypothetical protein
MRIGISGGLGPLRGGISTRGFGIGVGPVHASTGWPRLRRRRPRRSPASAGDLGALLGVLLAVGVVAFLVAWPYLLGTWLAVQLGAGQDSVARAVTGWSFEIVAVTAAVLALVHGQRREEERRAARQQEEHHHGLVRRCDLLRTQLEELQQILDRLAAHPVGAADPRVKPTEKLLAVLDDIQLLEPRSARRGGPRMPTAVDTGIVVITDKAIRFTGTTKTVEWRFDKMHAIRADADALLFPVTNRQLISGLRAPRPRRPALQAAVGWGVTQAAGATTTQVQAEVRPSRDAVAQALHGAERELAASGLPAPTS